MNGRLVGSPLGRARRRRRAAHADQLVQCGQHPDQLDRFALQRPARATVTVTDQQNAEDSYSSMITIEIPIDPPVYVDGCSTTGRAGAATGALWLTALALVLVRRRRRRHA